MFRKFFATTALIVGVSLALVGCGSGDESEEVLTPEAAGKNYTVEYVSVAGSNYECLWWNKDYRSGSMTCFDYTGSKESVKWTESAGYTVERIVKNDEQYTCVWYNQGMRAGSMSCLKDTSW